MDSSEQTGGASLIAASLTVTNRAEYAVSFSAIKFCEDEGVDVVSGVHLILSTDEESARQRAMQIATDKYKPADGYVGHVVAAVKIFGVAVPIELLETSVAEGGNETKEQLAAYAHEAWAGWMKYMFSKCEEAKDGLLIPGEMVTR